MEHPEKTWEKIIIESLKPTKKENIILPNINNLTSEQKDILIEKKYKQS